MQRDVQETKKTGTDALETKTTTYLPGVDGLAPAMKTDELQNRIGAHTLEVQKTTLLADGTGSWQVGEVRKSTVTEEDKGFQQRGAGVAAMVPGWQAHGSLPALCTPNRSQLLGQKREIQDTYSTETPGKSPPMGNFTWFSGSRLLSRPLQMASKRQRNK